MDNCLEHLLARPSHIFDLITLAPPYLNHKRKTHKTSSTTLNCSGSNDFCATFYNENYLQKVETGTSKP